MKKCDYAPPVEHGAQWIDPPIEQWDTLWQANLDLRSRATELRIDGRELESLQHEARTELLRLAWQYSQQYLDNQPAFDRFMNPSQPPAVMMSGHQPELFHPGVWFKNFVLSRQSRHQAAIPVNLIIDNDLCTGRSLRVPAGSGQPESLIEVPLDRHLQPSPFEGAVIHDPEWFESAGARVTNAMSDWVAQPIMAQLWPEVLRASDGLKAAGSGAGSGAGFGNFGQALAAGRHRLESLHGLQTLELPLSQLARTRGFAQFAWQLLQEASRFLSLHNQGLLEYRRLYNLRSKTHPFPELEQREEWSETPFWIFHQAATRRSAVFVRQRSDGLELTDLNGWTLGGLRNSGDLLDAMDQQRLPLRPRALTTTLYSRLVLSDLFIHGTGGGKYDQLTNELALRFWQVQLPDFCVASATYRLFPVDSNLTAEKIHQSKQQLRALEMNPDRFLDSLEGSEQVPPDVRAAAELKRAWIRGEQTGSGKERHGAIAECNRILQRWAEPWRSRLQEKLQSDLRRQALESELGSREFSFCLHPIERIEQLLQY